MRASAEHPAAPRRRRHRPLAGLAAVAAAVLLAAPAARAGVEIVVRADGSRVVRNVGPAAASASAARSSAPRRPAAPRPELRALVAEHAAVHDLDPRLVEAVIQAESAWNRRAVSRAGAMGLMQLMPDTAVVLAVDDPWDEGQNVRGGTAYLAEMLRRFGSEELALAAYNAGPGAVERHGGIPPYAETREYVRRVLSLYHGRHVGQDELAPFHGRAAAGGGAAVRRGAPPGFVRGGDGRLVLTNTGRSSGAAAPPRRTAPRRPAAAVAAVAAARSTSAAGQP
jgi:soluble lytic murein transglycosylase-like protein